MRDILPLANTYHHSNCWGTTQWTLGYQDNERPEYVEAEDMNEWLEENTVVVDKPAVGDVLVIRNSKSSRFSPRATSNFLVHTAVYLGGGDYWHQIGCYGPFQVDPFKAVMAIYGERDSAVEYRRVV